MKQSPRWVRWLGSTIGGLVLVAVALVLLIVVIWLVRVLGAVVS